MRNLWGRDDGNASITTVGLIAAITSVLLALCIMFTQARDHHQAQLAADMAAIAGAWQSAYGHNGCLEAATFAQLNGASVETCSSRDGDITVTVTVGRRTASARAGPI